MKLTPQQEKQLYEICIEGLEEDARLKETMTPEQWDNFTKVVEGELELAFYALRGGRVH
jgi:hypothetical protein